MQKGIAPASGSGDVRELENVEGVMPSVPWAPKRSRNRAQHGRAADKVLANVKRRRTLAACAKQRTHSARKRNALLTLP